MSRLSSLTNLSLSKVPVSVPQLFSPLHGLVFLRIQMQQTSYGQGQRKDDYPVIRSVPLSMLMHRILTLR